MGILTDFLNDQSVSITEFGNGVYRFDCTGETTFARALSQFLETYPNLRITAISDFGNGAGVYGHVVVTEKVR